MRSTAIHSMNLAKKREYSLLCLAALYETALVHPCVLHMFCERKSIYVRKALFYYSLLKGKPLKDHVKNFTHRRLKA